MKKAFDQTVRDLKREVNKKVLKVPSIEQKVLDATSNEPWGPHGSLLADVALASRNYHEYHMIMSVIWKRINDTGKNWRHVYKALIVLEYLVAHGSERVIDDIREHAYQISTLSDFQYIDSSGKDQGNNVRRKSQSLVVLVNDKERIQEVRQKAASNRDKYRNTSTGSMYRPSSGGYGDRYDDDRYESRHGYRDDDRNGYGRERDWGPRDDDRYGRNGDSYGRERDRYSTSEDRYNRDGYRGDDLRGRGQSVDDYRYGTRSRSADRDQFRAYDNDAQYSSRGSGAKTDDFSQDGSNAGNRLERRYSEQNLGAPPSYEEAVGATTRSPTLSERDGDSSQPSAPKASSPPGASPTHSTAAPAAFPASPPAPASVQTTAQNSNKEVDGFDEFDPRGPFSAPTVTNVATPATSVGAEMDILGSLSESFSANSLALVPADEPSANFTSGPTLSASSSASTIPNQPFDDPFGDGPFRAVPSTDSLPGQQQINTSANSFTANSNQSLDVPQPVPPTNSLFGHQELSNQDQDIDILAGILPPSTSSFADNQTNYTIPPGQSGFQSGFPPPTNQSGLTPLSGQNAPQNSFQAQNNQPAGFLAQTGQPSLQAGYPLQSARSVPQTSFPGQTLALTYPVQANQASQVGFHSQSGQPAAGFSSPVGPSQSGVQGPFGNQSVQPNPQSTFYGSYQSQFGSTNLAGGNAAPPSSIGHQNFLSQSDPSVPAASVMGPQAPHVRPNPLVPMSTTPASTGSSATVPQPSKDKFETKSTVWADTLSRGLVNLNISGSKTNPLADIGVDFDAINRKEKRMEKPTTAAVASTITMGKAMGSGSGMGRAGAGALRPPSNPMMGPGMSGGPGGSMSMGGYGVSQPMGRGMGMGMGMGMNMPGSMGMGMNSGMGQGMQQQTGFPQGSMPGGYNPMMRPGNYGQQPYGGGYRSS